MAIYDHRYNQLDQVSREVMLEIMHNPRAPISMRVDMAIHLLKLGYESGDHFVERPHWPGEARITIVIHGIPDMTSVTVDGQEDQDHGPRLVGHA
jgi:hypothetical protein